MIAIKGREYPRAGHKIRMPASGYVESPSFMRTYPRVINKELIEPNYREWIESYWRKEFFEARNLEIFYIRGAYLVNECLILDDDLRFIENASDDYPDHEIARAIAAVAKETEEGVLQNYDKVTIVAKKRSAHNYGHFLMECLPMAVIAKQALSAFDGELQYMIQRVPSPMQDAMFRAFRLLDVDLDDVLVQGFREPLHFEHLLVVRGISEHGEYLSPLAVQPAETIARRQVDSGTAMLGRSSEKLFVRRVPALGRGRELLNENEVAERLSAAGFLVIEPGSMTLEQQIMTFRGADQIVGVCGAAMANIAFCKPGATVTLLFPAMFPDVFFWFIATHKRLNYTEIRGRQISYDSPNSWERGFCLDEKDIQFLETL